MGETVYEIDERVLGRQPTVVGRGILFLAEIGPWLNHVYERVAAHVRELDGTMTGPPFARFTPLGGSGSLEVEAGFPVSVELTGTGDLLAAHLPGGPAAAMVHEGAYESLESAYLELSAWLERRGARPAGAAWEVYHPLDGAAPDPASARTEIIQPFLLD